MYKIQIKNGNAWPFIPPTMIYSGKRLCTLLRIPHFTIAISEISCTYLGDVYKSRDYERNAFNFWTTGAGAHSATPCALFVRLDVVSRIQVQNLLSLCSGDHDCALEERYTAFKFLPPWRQASPNIWLISVRAGLTNT